MNRRHAFLEVELCCATAPLWIYQTHSTSRALTLQLCSKDLGSNMHYHDDNHDFKSWLLLIVAVCGIVHVLHHVHLIRLEQDKQVCFILVISTYLFFIFLNVSFSQFGNHCTFSFFICVLFSEASVPLLVDILCHLSDCKHATHLDVTIVNMIINHNSKKK